MISLSLKTIRTAHERVEQLYQPDQVGREGDGFTIVSPVRLAFDIYKDRDQFRLAGDLQTSIQLECSRCLEPFARPIDASFDLRYQPHYRNAGEGEVEVEEDDLTTAFYENDQIDLGQLIREQLYLALPMKPLCAVLCKGLCPVCGTNLNDGTCECKSTWEDPRLAPLRGLESDRTNEH